MLVSDQRNESIPDLAQTTNELTVANNQINSSRFSGRRFILVNVADPDYSRDVLYVQGNIQINFSCDIMDVHIDELTKEELVHKLEAHFNKIVPE